MKETTGATVLMGLATVIILIFIIMVSFFISYGKAFRLKSLIINRIEQQEGMIDTEMNEFVGTSGVYAGKKIGACYEPIYHNGNLDGFIVRVIVSFGMDRTILGEQFNINVPIVGETRVIQKGDYLSPANETSLAYKLGMSKCEDGYTEV